MTTNDCAKSNRYLLFFLMLFNGMIVKKKKNAKSDQSNLCDKMDHIYLYNKKKHKKINVSSHEW